VNCERASCNCIDGLCRPCITIYITTWHEHPEDGRKSSGLPWLISRYPYSVLFSQHSHKDLRKNHERKHYKCWNYFTSHTSNGHSGIITYKQLLIITQILCHDHPYTARASSLLRLHDQTHLDIPHSVGLLWMSDQPDADTPTWQQTTLHAPVGFQPAVLASVGPHTSALVRATTGKGSVHNYEKKNLALRF
jgi:hypothetical protein